MYVANKSENRKQKADVNIPTAISSMSPALMMFPTSGFLSSALNLAENLVMAEGMPKSIKPIKMDGTTIDKEKRP